ncbi:hypothetical protein Leryth_022194 [Lithospermum erythrorhizon]|nr:hypothetical protein Leryth_022194 [Lithospermum erythrorhizon]
MFILSNPLTLFVALTDANRLPTLAKSEVILNARST